MNKVKFHVSCPSCKKPIPFRDSFSSLFDVKMDQKNPSRFQKTPLKFSCKNCSKTLIFTGRTDTIGIVSIIIYGGTGALIFHLFDINIQLGILGLFLTLPFLVAGVAGMALATWIMVMNFGRLEIVPEVPATISLNRQMPPLPRFKIIMCGVSGFILWYVLNFALLWVENKFICVSPDSHWLILTNWVLAGGISGIAIGLYSKTNVHAATSVSALLIALLCSLINMFEPSLKNRQFIISLLMLIAVVASLYSGAVVGARFLTGKRGKERSENDNQSHN